MQNTFHGLELRHFGQKIRDTSGADSESRHCMCVLSDSELWHWSFEEQRRQPELGTLEEAQDARCCAWSMWDLEIELICRLETFDD